MPSFQTALGVEASQPHQDPATARETQLSPVRHTFPRTQTLQLHLEEVASTKNLVVFLRQVEVTGIPRQFLLAHHGRTEVCVRLDQ